MKLDKNARRILKVVATDKWLISIYHAPEYLSGKLGIPMEMIDYELNVLQENQLIQWHDVEDGKQLDTNPAGLSEFSIEEEERKDKMFGNILQWVWPIVVVVLAGLINHVLHL